MLTRLLAAAVAALIGGWMLFDGVHVLVRGKYFGPDKPGPWSVPFARLGVDPFALGPLFVALGFAWIVCTIAGLTGQAWGWYAAAAVALATLWYFPLGTILSIAFLALLYFGVLRTASGGVPHPFP
jgi:hypothetical protein